MGTARSLAGAQLRSPPTVDVRCWAVRLLAAGSSERHANIRSCAGAISPSRRGAAPPAGLSRRRLGAPIRRSRGARHALLRGARQVGSQPCAAELAHAVPLDGQPVQGMHPCLHLLLCPPHPHVPRLRRRPRLRARDRGQGQRARGAARRARSPFVEGRARGAGDEHRPLPVGRGPLPADGGHLGGAARCGQPLLGADQVAAAAARPGADASRSRGAPRSAHACRSPRSTRRHGVPPSRTRPARGRAWRRSPSSTARASRLGC